jgi:hypothetical protein
VRDSRHRFYFFVLACFFFFCFRPREFFRSRFGKLFSKIAQLVCIFEKKEHLSQIRSAQPKAHAM